MQLDTLNKEQKSILIGSILGDAYLQTTGKQNARLRFEQGAKQKDYLFWKVDKFSNLFNGEPKYIKRKHPISNNSYEYWRHQSYSTKEFGKWQKIFYSNKKKIIPLNLEKLLDPISLAVWYMDDGYCYKRDKVSYIYLGKVLKEEAVITQDAILKNFQIKSKVLDKKNKGFAIYFSRIESEKLHNLIRKFILPSFYYKLS